MQRVYILMEDFKAVDTLVKFLNENVSPSPDIAEIEVDGDATFGENAQTLINKMKEVEKQVAKINKDLSKQLEPHVYEKLTDDDTDFEAKLEFFRTLKTSIQVTESVLSTIAGFLLISEAVTAARFVAVITGASEILFASFAGVVAGLFVAGAAIAVDSIISGIVGAVERSKLNDMIDTLDNVLDKFEGPSEDFTKNVYEVLGVVSFFLKEKKH